MSQLRPLSVPLAPPPWDLRGSAYLFAVKMPRELLDQGSFLPPGQVRAGRGRLVYAMYVDYARSDVGPYRELLYIPGPLRFGDTSRLSITRIFVSTWDSVINGEINWGIPKDRCDFSVAYDADGIDRVRLTAANGDTIAEMELESRGLRLPFPGHWVPERYRTLSQLREGKLYTYAPKASGRFKLARVRRWRFDARYFPDLAQGQVVSAIRLTDFRMAFPVARMEPAPAMANEALTAAMPSQGFSR